MAFWAFIGSECLLFGLRSFSTYLVSIKGRVVVGPYPHDILNIPLTSGSTFDLLMSSLMMVLALAAGAARRHEVGVRSGCSRLPCSGSCFWARR